MIWIFALFGFGLIGFLVEMWLGYQKQAIAFRARQEQLRQQIEGHLQAIDEARKKTEVVRERVKEVENKLAALKKERDFAKGALTTAEAREQKRRPTRHRLKENEEDI